MDGRFAPSPTGVLHLGNLRTALLAWLFARSAGARFIVRIEDLDRERVVPGLADRQLDDLAELGLDWDEQPVAQSERLHLYADAVRQLEDRDLLYRCYCTRADIRDAASAPHGSSTDSGYPGTCRTLTREQVASHELAGRGWCLRVRGSNSAEEYEDRLLGRVSGFVDDFVVVRKDGVPAYNLAVVVDDESQRVGEVVRGADLADSTPRQLWLQRALGYSQPRYAHVPLMLDADGRRLSKRQADVTLDDWRKAGLRGDDVRDYLAAGLGLGERREKPRMQQLVERFDPAKLPREPTRLSESPLA